MSGEEEQHEDWCEEHVEEGCATDWSGAVDFENDTELSTRTLQRQGERPVLQIALKSAGQEVVADFNPFGKGANWIGEFADLLAGELNHAMGAADAFDQAQKARG